VGFQRQSGPIAVMLYEHDEGRALVRAMAEAIERYATGDSGALAPLARHARQFCGLLRAHIQKEDNVLFMMADMHIPPEEQSKLEQEFTKLESSGEACMLKVELLSLLERMEQDVWQPA
jgi:hemerythrin-like domain-containing protein